MTSMGRVIVDEAFSIAAAPDPDVEGLVREHSRFVYRIAYSILRNPQDAALANFGSRDERNSVVIVSEEVLSEIQSHAWEPFGSRKLA